MWHFYCAYHRIISSHNLCTFALKNVVEAKFSLTCLKDSIHLCLHIHSHVTSVLLIHTAS